jgi:hypothetical protein
LVREEEFGDYDGGISIVAAFAIALRGRKQTSWRLNKLIETNSAAQAAQFATRIFAEACNYSRSMGWIL